MSKRNIISLRRIILGILVVLTLIFIWIAYKNHFFREYYTLAKLDCGNGRKIVISAKHISRETQSMHCQIFDQGIEVVPRTWVDVSDNNFFDELHLKPITSGDGELVAVVREEYPYVVFLIYDFPKHELQLRPPFTQNGIKFDLLEHLAIDHPEIMEAPWLPDAKQKLSIIEQMQE